MNNFSHKSSVAGWIMMGHHHGVVRLCSGSEPKEHLLQKKTIITTTTSTCRSVGVHLPWNDRAIEHDTSCLCVCVDRSGCDLGTPGYQKYYKQPNKSGREILIVDLLLLFLLYVDCIFFPFTWVLYRWVSQSHYGGGGPNNRTLSTLMNACGREYL